MNFASIEMASPLTAGPTLSRARLDKSLVDKARSLRASVAELLATAPEPPDGLGKANPAAAHTSRAAVRGLVLDLLDREAVALMASGRDPLPALDERTLVDLVLAMLFGLGLLQVFIDDEMVENISRCSDMGKLRIVQVSNVLPGHSVYHFCVSAKPWFESGTAFLAATGRWLLPDSREWPVATPERALSDWHKINPDTVYDPELFRREILPRLATVKLSEISSAAGCSKASASDYQRGKRTPHVSTRAALASWADHLLRRLSAQTRRPRTLHRTSRASDPHFHKGIGDRERRNVRPRSS